MITSTANQKVKRIVQLGRKASLRKQEKVFIAEGTKMFLEAPEDGLEEVYVSESFLQNMGTGELGEKLQRQRYEEVSDQVFARMSDTQAPQGILCVARQPQYTLEEMLKAEKVPLFLLLENLQDPGNLGTILRTGEGAGITGVIMSRDTVDIYNPKAIRSTMGSVYRVPFLYVEDIRAVLCRLREQGTLVYAAHLEGEKSYDEYDYTGAAAFLVGNEGKGLTEETAVLADAYIRIPMAGKVESLNAGVASALLLYEAARQRGWEG